MDDTKKYLIYKHINKTNGKIYVGQTCQKINSRWSNGNGYECFYTDSNGNKKPSRFWNAIQKYGWDNFEHKISIHGLTKEQADRWEKKLIKEWNLMNPDFGYNLKEGGSHGRISEEIKKKISLSHIKNKNSMYGKRHTEESKIKMSESQKKRFKNKENHPMYKRKGTMLGKCHTEESKQKMSKTRKEKYKSGELIPYNKGKSFSEETRKKMSESRKENFKNGKIIPSMLGKHHSNETKNKISKSRKSVSPSYRVKVMRLRDNKIYNLLIDCAKDNNLSRVTIRKHCQNKVKTPMFQYI